MKQKKKLIKYIFPTLGDVIFAAIFAGAFLLGPQMMNQDGDLGRHLTIGHHILKSRTIPTGDIFSHTMTGEALTPHEWFAQVLFAAADCIAGFDGVVWLTSFVIAFTFYRIYKRIKEKTGWIIIPAVFTLWGAAAASLHWLTRPHIFTFMFVTLWMEVIDSMRAGNSRWWLLPLLMLVWVNTHGAFVAGFVIWGMVVLGMIVDNELNTWGQTQPWVFSGVLSFLVTGLNPVGYSIWETSIGFLANDYLVGHTQEYLPPDFHHFSTWPFLILILASIMLLGSSRRKTSLSSLLLLTGWMGMSLISARNIPLFVVVAVPIVAQTFVQAVKIDWDSKILRWWVDIEDRFNNIELSVSSGAGIILLITALGLLVAVVANLSFIQTNNTFSEQVFPRKSMMWVKENPPSGRMFNHFPWGGYILHQAWPDYLVFIDGQTDFYGEELTREYECVITLCPEWEEVLEKYQVEWAIIPADSRLSNRLQKHETWKLTFKGDPGWVFVTE